MDVQDELLTHVEGRALVITLNCPDKGNAATEGSVARTSPRVVGKEFIGELY